jgi:hypothetical protein
MKEVMKEVIDWVLINTAHSWNMFAMVYVPIYISAAL